MLQLLHTLHSVHQLPLDLHQGTSYVLRMTVTSLGIPDAWWKMLFDGYVREVQLDQAGLSGFDLSSFVGAVRRAAKARDRTIITRQWPQQRLLAVQAYGLPNAPMPEVFMFARKGPLPEVASRQPMPHITALVVPPVPGQPFHWPPSKPQVPVYDDADEAMFAEMFARCDCPLAGDRSQAHLSTCAVWG
jgi:hypothetical protein